MVGLYLSHLHYLYTASYVSLVDSNTVLFNWLIYLPEKQSHFTEETKDVTSISSIVTIDLVTIILII